jgi:hypothetical protein
LDYAKIQKSIMPTLDKTNLSKEKRDNYCLAAE